MEANNKRLGGLFSGMPSYHMLSNPAQNSQNNDLIKLIQQEENKFWSVKPLYIFAALQMIFGIFLFSAQIALNNIGLSCETMMNQITSEYSHYVPIISEHLVCLPIGQRRIFALWCGGIIFFTGLITALATKYKTSFLLVVSSFLCVVGYGVSICCLIMSAVYAQIDPYNASGTYIGMAVISGINFLIFVLTSALFCRASCSCCQPHTSTIMYLSYVGDSTSNRQIEALPRQTPLSIGVTTVEKG